MVSITKKDKKLLISFLGIALLVVSFFYIYQPFHEKTNTIKQENIEKQRELDRLKGLEEKRDYFVSETDRMKRESEQYQAQFPIEIREEDGILLARDMEKKMDISITDVQLGTREFLYASDGTLPVEEEEENKTLAEQNGQATQDRINEIEGNVEEDSNSTAVQEYTKDALALYRTQDRIQFSITYQGLKDMIQYMNRLSKRTIVNSLNLNYDSSTGQLTGDATLDLFTLEGVDGTYEEPNAGQIKQGTKNIFGTIESNKKSKKNGK